MQFLLATNFRIFVLLLLTGFAIYANVIPGKFLFDDNLFIENNEHIKSLSNIPKLYFSSVTEGSSVSKDNFYRPNQQAINSLLYACFGLNPIPFHITSILFHIINSCLIFLFFLKLGITRTVSFFSSVIFLIHPVNTQAISYISGMADPVGLTFILSALLFFLKAIANYPGKVKWKTAALPSILFFILGILTKENAVVFPALALITYIFLTRGRLQINLSENRSVFVLLGIYFSLALSYVYLKFTVLNFAGNTGLTDQKNIYTENIHIRLITFLNILPEYLKMLFFPVRLNYEKPYTAFVNFQRPEAILSLVLFLAGAGIAIYSLVKKNVKTPDTLPGNRRAAFFAFAWFFICLAPVSGIIPVNAMYLEHWLYYPMIGVIFYGAATYETSKPFTRNIFLVLIIPLSIMYAGRTVLRNSEWASPEKFYKNELKYSPNSARIHNNLAMVYAEEKKCPQAIVHYKKAIALYDVYPQTHHNLARCYETTGNVSEAVNEYFRALLLYPNFTHSHRYLLNIYQHAGDTALSGIFARFITRIERGETIDQNEIISVIQSLKK